MSIYVAIVRLSVNTYSGAVRKLMHKNCTAYLLPLKVALDTSALPDSIAFSSKTYTLHISEPRL
jgi:hypothetical protein